MAGMSKSEQLYRAMLDEHRELLGAVHELRKAWRDVDAQERPRGPNLDRRLRDFRDTLASHFDEEERDGYLSAALSVAPRFHSEAAELCAQHRAFLQTLDEFLADLSPERTQPCDWNDLQRRFEEFVLELRKHEGAENAIVQSAFGDDVGIAD